MQSDLFVAADRLMSWDATGYGSDLEASIDGPGLTWYLAEGATGGPYSLYYLLQNPGATDATVTVTYLLPTPRAPVIKSYPVKANSRFTIDVAAEDPALAAAEVSAKFTSTEPIVVERAMYFTTPGQFLAAGHAGAAVPAASTEWLLAEGATGFFDEYVLIANAEDAPASVQATYLLENGESFFERFMVDAHSRYTLDLKHHPRLAATPVSVSIRSANNTNPGPPLVPVVVERVMWWPHGNWQEASLSAGVIGSSSLWTIAEGEQGGAANAQTYILIANALTDTTASVTLLYEDGTMDQRVVDVPRLGRTTVDAGSFASSANRRFAVIVQSIDDTPIVVERSLYHSVGGVHWAAGGTSVGVRGRPRF